MISFSILFNFENISTVSILNLSLIISYILKILNNQNDYFVISRINPTSSTISASSCAADTDSLSILKICSLFNSKPSISTAPNFSISCTISGFLRSPETLFVSFPNAGPIFPKSGITLTILKINNQHITHSTIPSLRIFLSLVMSFAFKTLAVATIIWSWISKFFGINLMV